MSFGATNHRLENIATFHEKLCWRRQDDNKNFVNSESLKTWNIVLIKNNSDNAEKWTEKEINLPVVATASFVYAINAIGILK